MPIQNMQAALVRNSTGKRTRAGLPVAMAVKYIARVHRQRGMFSCLT
jgi:hypothetical protein